MCSHYARVDGGEKISAERHASASASASYCCRNGFVEESYRGLSAELSVTASPADVPGMAGADGAEAVRRGEAVRGDSLGDARGDARGELRGDARDGD